MNKMIDILDRPLFPRQYTKKAANILSTWLTWLRWHRYRLTCIYILPLCANKSNQQPITLKLSGKVIKNRFYRTPLSEYASTYDENNVENCGKPLPRYTELYQGTVSPSITIQNNKME